MKNSGKRYHVEANVNAREVREDVGSKQQNGEWHGRQPNIEAARRDARRMSGDVTHSRNAHLDLEN